LKAAFYEGNEQIRIGACTPIAPALDEVQIRVSHCGICGTDLHVFHGAMDHRVTLPAVIGHEMSGVIESVGADVQGWATGDRASAGFLRHVPGLPERAFAHLPATEIHRH
jgi:(R,R)-butanediol dehydrogenase / meso-butanediol dehydrogenase / diacetyl reductase